MQAPKLSVRLSWSALWFHHRHVGKQQLSSRDLSLLPRKERCVTQFILLCLVNETILYQSLGCQEKISGERQGRPAVETWVCCREGKGVLLNFYYCVLLIRLYYHTLGCQEEISVGQKKPGKGQVRPDAKGKHCHSCRGEGYSEPAPFTISGDVSLSFPSRNRLSICKKI
jgi:hypothetical protein